MNKQQLPRDITPRVKDPWPLFLYTRYIQSLSMFIWTFSFLAFLGSEKTVTKILRMAKFENLPRDIAPWGSEKSVRIFKNGKIWKQKPTKGHNSNSYGPLAPIPVYTIHPVIVHVYTNFQLSSFHSSWEICYENFQEWQNLKTYQGT